MNVLLGLGHYLFFSEKKNKLVLQLEIIKLLNENEAIAEIIFRKADI
jgi:hypothetical protein